MRFQQSNNDTVRSEGSNVLEAATLLLSSVSGVEYETLPTEEKLRCVAEATEALICAVQASDYPTQPVNTRPRVFGQKLQVLEMLSDGMRPKEIAQELGSSEFTVRNHIRGLRETFGVHRYPEAVAKAQRMGIVSHSKML